MSGQIRVHAALDAPPRLMVVLHTRLARSKYHGENMSASMMILLRNLAVLQTGSLIVYSGLCETKARPEWLPAIVRSERPYVEG